MNDIAIVVIIATSMNRTDLLIERSLRSVYHQQLPNITGIYVVDDNESEDVYFEVARRVEQLRKICFVELCGEVGEVPENWFSTCVVRNQRTRFHSGSGAWNTAALLAYQNRNRERLTYLALLDDDDEWCPEYLRRCYSRVVDKPDVAVVISSYIRREKDLDRPVLIDHGRILQSEFFIGNPGWQGSNTFVELSMYWKAGGFDESMPSTLDRDFAIRVLDVCDHDKKQVVTIDDRLVIHYAHTGMRVTNHKMNKALGLDQFYNKYLCRMSNIEFRNSIARAYKYFDYEFRGKYEAQQEVTLDFDCYANEAAIPLVLGVVSSSTKAVMAQFNSLACQIENEPQFVGCCQYVVVTNGFEDLSIERSLRGIKNAGIEIVCITLSQQQEILSRFPYRDEYKGESIDNKSISFSRSLLHFICWEHSQVNDSKVLILDDDIHFESLMIVDGELSSVRLNYLGKLAKISRSSQADIVISRYTDAPALPFYSSLRTQLLDIKHSIYGFSSESILDCSGLGADQLLRWSQHEDYYYDLSSSCYQHLESPIGWLPEVALPDSEKSKVFPKFLDDLCHLGEEANITRPLILNGRRWAEIEGGTCFRRGGIAFYRDTSLLVEVPNLSPRIQRGQRVSRTRRSDFVSAIYLSVVLNKRIEVLDIPLRHNRRLQNRPCEMSASKLADDIVGACFYRVFRAYLDGKVTVVTEISTLFENLCSESIMKLEIHNLRVIGLFDQIESLLNRPFQWWNSCSEADQISEKIDLANRSLNRLKSEVLISGMSAQLADVRKIIEKFDVAIEIDRLCGAFNSNQLRNEKHVEIIL